MTLFEEYPYLNDWKTIAQGAEAKILEGELDGKLSVAKVRLAKKYRVEALDKSINSKRFKQEMKNIEKAQKCGILTPNIYLTNKKLYLLIMEKIKGLTMKSYINFLPKQEELIGVIQRMGETVAKIHNNHLVHGDLTTSNFLLNESQQIVVIDWGLSFVSEKAEDKAVDLYVLERAFNSTHPNHPELFDVFLKAYESILIDQNIIPKFNEVRLRGRKRHAFG